MSLQRPVTEANTMGAVPRSSKQVQDMKYKLKLQRPDPIDNVRVLMTSEKGTTERFIRRFTITDDCFSLCLFTNEQLQLLMKNSSAGIHVDTTFNIANMFALVTTLRAVEYEGDRIVCGPILLTTRQRQRDYCILWQELTAEIPSLAEESLYFVTDGEQALAGSILQQFPNSTLFRCMLHLRDNIKKKAKDFSLSPQLCKMVLQDTSEILNCESSEFSSHVDDELEKWLKESERVQCGTEMEKFISYYRRQVLKVLKENLAEHIESAGVGVGRLTNNSSESMNSIIKGWCGTAKTVDEVVKQLKTGILGQQEELVKGKLSLSRKFVKKTVESVAPVDNSRYVSQTGIFCRVVTIHVIFDELGL